MNEMISHEAPTETRDPYNAIFSSVYMCGVTGERNDHILFFFFQLHIYPSFGYSCERKQCGADKNEQQWSLLELLWGEE
jgi:thiamine pyrophosphokinase